MKSAVIVFPGSNCDRDIYTIMEAVFGQKPERVWHGDHELPKVDFIAVPGGFSYGDYLRCGAMAAKSPIMKEVVKAANDGIKVLGVCNGFQILTEVGLLPGALIRNRDLHYICRPVTLKVENNQTDFTKNYQKEQIVTMPIAHHDGNYVASEEQLKILEGNGQIIFRYANKEGICDAASNPNGSLNNIAGITNPAKNVLGMMPHPERYADAQLGGEEGRILFESLLAKG